MLCNKSDIESQFLEVVRAYDSVVRKVCFMYTSPSTAFDDLYQEIMVNLWNGFKSFRGDSKMSTWIYRMSINTCVSWYRRNNRHTSLECIDNAINQIAADEDEEHRRNLKELYKLISGLDVLERAIVMMWLDEKSYDEIADVTGLSRAAVGTRLHRIRRKLKSSADYDSTAGTT